MKALVVEIKESLNSELLVTGIVKNLKSWYLIIILYSV